MISERLYLERQRRLDALGSCPPWWRPLRRRAWRQRVARTMAMGITVYDEMFYDYYPADTIRQIAGRPSFTKILIREPGGDV